MCFPTLKNLAEFLERPVEAANYPVFGKANDDSRMHSLKEVTQKPVDNPLLASLSAVAGTKTTTMAVQVGPSDPRNSEKDSNSTTYAKSKMLWVGSICP